MDQKKETLHVHDELEQSSLAAILRLQELSARLIQADGLNDLLQEIVAASAQITGTDKANLQLLNQQTNQLEIVAHQGLSSRYVGYFAKQGCPGACETAKEVKSRVILEDLTKVDAREYPHVKMILDEGILAVQCTPLICRSGRLVGMLNNHFSYRHKPGEQDLRFLDLLARMAADLIERKQFQEQLLQSHADMEKRVNQRTAELDAKNIELQNRTEQLARLASEITLAEEQERHRLSHVLHDHLQQILVAAKLELSVLTRRVGEGEHQPLIEDIAGLIDESIRESRTLTIELSPPILHEAGLTAGLQWLVRRMQEKYAFDVVLDIAPQIDMERDDVSILCFQAVRELLFNCVKHSGVKTAQITVRHDSQNGLQITVSDNGRGFDPIRAGQKAGSNGGFGLFSIRERLILLGGSFEIKSQPGRGSIFSLTVPHSALKTPKADSPMIAESVVPVRACANGKIRILLVDDHIVMRRGLASMLRHEDDIEVVGEAQDGQEAVEMARRLLPDIILMDYSMPRMNGVEAAKRIHMEMPAIGIIGLSMYDEAERSAAMMDVGASAYTSKSEPPEVIIAAIRRVFSAVKESPKKQLSIKIVNEPSINIAETVLTAQHRPKPKKQSETLQKALFD